MLIGLLACVSMLLLPLFAWNASFAAPDQTPVEAAPASDFSSYKKVSATDYFEFRAYLQADRDYYITIKNDFDEESEDLGSTFADIPLIEVKGNKVIDFAGHSVYVSDKSELVKKDGTWVYRSDDNYLDKYYKTLITIKDGADLTIFDATGNGGLQFDSQFADMWLQKINVTRNVFQVEKGGKLTVHGGIFKAGREKTSFTKCRSDKSDLFGNHPAIYRNIYGYNMGAAVIVDGGSFVSTGGIFIGNGLERVFTDSKAGALWFHDVEGSSVLIEGGNFYGYGNAPAFGIHGVYEINGGRPYRDRITIKDGYYEATARDNVAFEDLPDDWKCPRCKQPKEKFNKA